jgi:hypothetical protein
MVTCGVDDLMRPGTDSDLASIYVQGPGRAGINGSQCGDGEDWRNGEDRATKAGDDRVQALIF